MVIGWHLENNIYGMLRWTAEGALKFKSIPASDINENVATCPISDVMGCWRRLRKTRRNIRSEDVSAKKTGRVKGRIVIKKVKGMYELACPSVKLR